MDASKVTFFSATKEALSNPGLDYKKRRALKIERVKALIRSKPAGYRFRMQDLIAAAGYTVSNRGSYASGYGFIKALDGKELAIEKTSKYRKSVIILKDDTVQTLTPKREETVYPVLPGEPEKPTEEKTPSAVALPSLGEVDVALVRQIEVLARRFAWLSNSNDLREFVRSLK